MTLADWLTRTIEALDAPWAADRLTPDALAAWFAAGLAENPRAFEPAVSAWLAPILDASARDAAEPYFIAPTVHGLTAAHGFWAWLRSHGVTLKHPLAPLVAAWLDAHRPGAAADRWPRPSIPRLVTSERDGEPASIVVTPDAAHVAPATLTLPGLGPLELPAAAAPQPAYLPGFTPADAPAGVIPAAWLALIDGFARSASDARTWQRALRLFIEVVSHPAPEDRRGLVTVALPVGGPDGLIRRLWPNDPHVRQHYPDLRQALGLVASQALPTSDGRMFLPAQLARWQRPDALRFDVAYPQRGGGGATYDRALFRRYGVHPRLLRVYLASVWALDARSLRRRDGDDWLADLALDALADLAAYPDVPRDGATRRQHRARTLAALDRLAADGAIGGYDLAGRGRSRRLALWRPRRALPAPADAPPDCD